MIELRPILESHAAALFPLVFRTAVTHTLIWDGPQSIEEYRNALKVREERTRTGEELTYAIFDAHGDGVGSIGLHFDVANQSATVGLWIAIPFQGLGYGSAAVGEMVKLGFGTMKLERLEARIYVGNSASKRIFEKNGFVLEGTLRRIAYKRDEFLDQWVMGAIREEWERLA